MEKPKTLFRFWFLFFWQIGQTQSLLENMAARGWHLSHFGDFLAVFRQGPPDKVRYRCDYYKFRNPELRDKIDLYAASGWQYLGSRQETHIFRAEDPAVPEIHTDSQEYKFATSRLRRGLIIIAVASTLVIPASIYRLVRDFPSWPLAIRHGTPTAWAWIAFSCYSLFFLVWHWWGFAAFWSGSGDNPRHSYRIVRTGWSILLGQRCCCSWWLPWPLNLLPYYK